MQEIFNFNINNELSNIEFPNLELAIVLTDDSINVIEKHIKLCNLYTVINISNISAGIIYNESFLHEE